MTRANGLPPGITETNDGYYDVRIGFRGHRFYLGTYSKVADARKHAETFREHLPAMFNAEGVEFVHQQAKQLREQRREERYAEGTTAHRAKVPVRKRLSELEERVQQLEEKFNGN